MLVDRRGVKVVSFDLWLTLIKSNATPNKASRAGALYKIFGMEPRGVTFDAFAAVVKMVEKTADVCSETSEQHYGPYERTQLVADHYGIPMMSDTDFKAFYALCSRQFMTYPPQLMQENLVEVLDQLAGRYTLALVSNTGFVNGAEMRPALQAIGILDFFTYQVFSDEVGVDKPNQKIFDYLLSLSGVEPRDIVHIGDNRLADYEGARALGLQAVHVSSSFTLDQAISILL